MQLCALRHEDLRTHEIDPGDLLGHGVLDLNPGIHLDEKPLVFVQIEQELDRPGIVISDLARDPRGGLAQFVADAVVQTHRRSYLHDFLVASLHRTIALVQMQHFAVSVTEDLHFDVLCARDILFEENSRVSKSALRFALSLVQQRIKIACLMDDAHPAPTAAKCRFDDQREPNVRRDLERLCAVVHWIVGSGKSRDLEFLGQSASRNLVSHQLEQLGARPDESNARFGASARESRVLRQESIARMNQVDALFLGQRDDPFHIEVSPDGPLPFAHEISLVRLEAVHGKAVLLRIDRDRAQAKLRRSAKDADGDFGAIGDEQFFRLVRLKGARSTRGRTHREGEFYWKARLQG